MTDMTSRERVNHAINHREPDRVPLDMWGTDSRLVDAFYFKVLEHLGWQDVADDIVRALEATIADKIVTYDFARLMDGAKEVKTSQFAKAIADRL